VPHAPDCNCPPCRYRRSGVTGDAPRLSVRLAPQIRDIILHHPTGARAYLESLVRAESSQQEAIQALEDKLKQANAQIKIYLDAFDTIEALPGPGSTIVRFARLAAQRV
jgi:hypothetical protein